MFKKIIYIFLPLVIGCAKIDSYTWVQTLPHPWELTEKELESYLFKFQSRFPDYKKYSWEDLKKIKKKIQELKIEI